MTGSRAGTGASGVHPEQAAPTPMADRLTRGRTVLLALGLALLLLAVTSAPWAQGSTPTVLGEEPVSVSGSAARPALLALILVAGAAALVMAIGRRGGAVIGGLGLLASAAGVAAITTGFLGEPDAALREAAAEASGVAELAGSADATVWPVIAMVMAILLGLLALAALLVSRGWPARADRRFQRQGAMEAPRRAASAASRASDARTRAMEDWDALGRGEDPTGQGPDEDPGSGRREPPR